MTRPPAPTPSPSPGRRPTTARHRLALDLTAAGPVGLAFDALDFSPSRPAAPADALRAWADRLAARVTYLMEPLVVLEHDPVAGEVDLRSQSPTARGELDAYYEVRLNARARSGSPASSSTRPTRRRRPAPCQLTREVLERLADDLVACAG